MATGSIKTEKRPSELSRHELTKMRDAGKIPANIYGKGMDPKSFFIGLFDFQNMYKTHGRIFELEIDGKKYLVNAKDIQQNPITRKVSHISFHKLEKDKVTTVEVPIKIVGIAPGVADGAIVTLIAQTVFVDALPSKIPESVTVDISHLQIDGHITFGELHLPNGVTIHETGSDKDDILKHTIVTCKFHSHKEDEKPAEDNLEPPLSVEKATTPNASPTPVIEEHKHKKAA